MPDTPAWLWLNLIDLDAPIVALIWQDLAAHTFGNPLRPAARLVLGLTVWAVYLADRLLDVRSSGAARAPNNTPRHQFHRRHAQAMRILLTAVLALDVFIATVDLRRAIVLYGLAVAVCVGVYLSIFPLRASGWEKQIAAAILFSAGVLLVTATWLSPLPLLLPAILFAALCLCNLALIELWERRVRRRLVWLAPLAVAALALLRPASPWEHAILLSGVLLAALAISAPRLTLNARRALADAALLTPLLFR